MLEEKWIEYAQETPDTLSKRFRFLTMSGPQCVPADDKRWLSFMCACFRLFDVDTHQQFKAIVRIAERYAVGLADGYEFLKAARLADTLHRDAHERLNNPPCLAHAKLLKLNHNELYAAWLITVGLSFSVKKFVEAVTWLSGMLNQTWAWTTPLPLDHYSYKWPNLRAAYFHDIFNPFAAPVDHRWLTTDVVRLATAAQASARNGKLDDDCLLVLADAVEEAGCTDERLLYHLRGYNVCPRCVGSDKRGRLHRYTARRGLDYYTCDSCDGSKWNRRAVPHVCGCWAVESLKRVV